MKFYLILFTFIWSCNALAAEDDFASLLEEMTEIATKTKLNIDYQPSVVSVLHADKLKNLGVSNLHEALGLLPGIETSILHTGWKQVIIRGNYSPDTFVFDKYKLYIDGVDIGSDLYSTSYFYLDFPIELIERIEVLRGSASTIYGPGAFSGAINVITSTAEAQNKSHYFAAVGSYDYIKGGLMQQFDAGDWNIGIDAYYQQNDKALYAGPSFVEDTNYARTDYDSLESFNDFSLGLIAKNDSFKLTTRYKSEETENFYGMNEALESVKGGYQQNKSFITEISHQTDFNKKLNLETKLGINYYHFTFDTSIIKDIMGLNPTFAQFNSYLDVNLKGSNFSQHQWLLGINLKKIDTRQNKISSKYPYITTREFLDAEHDQVIKSVYFQDIYALNDNIDLSANIRLDDYSIFDEMLSYRFGSVYRLTDQHIVKAIYGRSFRAPSYIEAFQSDIKGMKAGNPNLEPELIDTYELAYTYKNQNTILRTNIFYSLMKDVIDIVTSEPDTFVGDYANHKDRTAKGLEFEYTYQFDQGSELMTNLSYVKTQYFTPDYLNPIEFQSPEISQWMLKGYWLYPITSKLSLNSAWFYSGPKGEFDPYNTGNSQAIKSSLVIDETIVYQLNKSSTLRLSVKNLFNETIKYPSYHQKQEGIIREGRNWLLTFSKQF
ncbi:MAG: TonB-dependent receptor [Gammaproteobacteria bacterium]|nr:TonB-dependent receptor [Gammaproteobacteria bacterium]